MVLMAYTSGYLVVFATVMIAIALIARIAEWRHHPRAVLTASSIATVVTVVLVLLAIPYRRVAIEQNMVRSIEHVTDYSASLTGYIAAAGRVHFYTWSARFFANPVDSFFPGVVAIILSAFALRHGIRSGTHRSRLLMVVAIGLAGFVLSLGLRTPLYGWLYAVFPPMRGYAPRPDSVSFFWRWPSSPAWGSPRSGRRAPAAGSRRPRLPRSCS